MSDHPATVAVGNTGSVPARAVVSIQREAGVDKKVDIGWVGDRLSENVPLGPVDLEAIQSVPVAVRSFEAGQYLLREGDQPRQCSFLLSGFVYRHKIVGGGRRQIVAIHVPRDLIDVQQVMMDEADHNVQALTAGRLLVVQGEELVALARQRPAIAMALWHQMIVEASILREWVANVGRRDARARTAHWLCELALRSEAAGLGPRDLFDLPMTQEQIGDALGLTAVHVNRTLKSLEADGVITRNKRSVAIANWETLRVTGDFSSNYLHLRARAT